jgi:GAF domain-containing protein
MLRGPADRTADSPVHRTPRQDYRPSVTADRSSDANVVPSLGDVMSRLAQRLQEQHGDVEGTLQAITTAAVRTVPHADECGITYVIGRSTLEPRAWTGELPRAVDALQERLGQGPCVDAVRNHKVVRVDDVRSDDRWPEFAQAASGLGVGSMLCFQLFVEGDHLGAMNMYSRTPRAFDDESVDIGLLFASHAAVALAGAEHEEHLREAVATRDLIGQAKGILMERYKLTAVEAFSLLVTASNTTNHKLREVAEELATTGEMRVPQRRPEAS